MKYIQIKATIYAEIPVEDLIHESMVEWVSNNIDIDDDAEIEIQGVSEIE
tara:strand:- start:748 stop:897 length:150 start_codon:yes stop_codon:yes gene_type:complete